LLTSEFDNLERLLMSAADVRASTGERALSGRELPYLRLEQRPRPGHSVLASPPFINGRLLIEPHGALSGRELTDFARQSRNLRRPLYRSSTTSSFIP
jgi:hypothetical protein